MMGDWTRDDVVQWDQTHHWHAFTQMEEYEPLVIERAEGCWLIDVDGNRYLDGASSMWCNVHGHRHPRIDEAVRRQLDRVAHCTALGMGSDTAARLAKQLADLAPGHLEHVFFSSDGSSAVEVALKMAFQYWRQCPDPQPQKTKFVALGEAYHGDTIGSASVGGIPRFHALFKPLLFEVLRAPLPDLRRFERGMSPEAAAQALLAELEAILHAHHHQVAAIVIEPIVQCAAGMVMHPHGYLQGVRQLADRYQVLLIADEVAVGFGRTGTMFACQQEHVVPDFLCLGKGLSGGYLPLAATLTHGSVYQAFLGTYLEGRTLHHGHTYSGNALACAAALANLELFAEEATLEKLAEKSTRLGEHLCRIAEHSHVATTRQRGLIGALELTPDKATASPYPPQERRAWQVCRAAMRRGVWIRPLADVLYVMPPLSIERKDLDYLMGVLEASIDEVTTGSARPFGG